MTQEEKARAYDEALERARKMMDSKRSVVIRKQALETIFPELSESEDERIRKFLVDYFASYKIDNVTTKLNGVRIDDILNYLEKQKEQKPEHLELKAGHWYICHRAFCCRADHLTVKEGERFMCEKDGIVKGFVIKEPEKYFKECSAPAPMEDEQKEQKPERINVKEMVAKYGATDEYIEGEYKGKPINCMIRAYEQGIRDTLLKVKEQKPAEVDESTKRLNDNWMKQHFDDYKEQKPAEWSEEDKQCLDEAIEILENLGYDGDADNLKRLRPQPKQEWSEEDEKMIKFTLQLLDYHKFTDPNALSCKDWLKSLRPSWKPSEAQMRALNEIICLGEISYVGQEEELIALKNKLKKLM